MPARAAAAVRLRVELERLRRPRRMARFANPTRSTCPVSPYAATKKACELLAHTFHHLHGLPVTGLRFFTAYGPRNRPDLAIAKFTRLIDRGEPVPMFGDGTTRRDYTYVDDIVDGIVRAIDRCSAHHLYNLGHSQPVALRDLIEQIARAVGKQAAHRDAARTARRRPPDLRRHRPCSRTNWATLRKTTIRRRAAPLHRLVPVKQTGEQYVSAQPASGQGTVLESIDRRALRKGVESTAPDATKDPCASGAGRTIHLVALTRGPGTERGANASQTISFSDLSGSALTTLRAGLALYIIGSLVNGLIPAWPWWPACARPSA